MAIINIRLMATRIKPTFELETHFTTRSVLVDTGAHTVIRFDNVETFLLEFPEAKLTNMITYVGGLGGLEQIPCPIYEIPQFKLHDMDSEQTLVIHRLPVAIYDSEKEYGYDYLLGGTIFLKVNHAFMNAEKIRHMRIWYERDIYCCPILTKDDKTGKPVIHHGKNILSSVRTFFQNENIIE